MPLSITGLSQYNMQVTTSVSNSSTVQNQSQSVKKSMLETLKDSFPGVNFITNRDPLAGKNAKAKPTDTVYLDTEALQKIEKDPKYAAYVFSEIETSLTYGKGYTIREGNRVVKKLPGAQTMSFYGRKETSASASASGSFGAITKAGSMPNIFTMALNTYMKSKNTSSASNNSFHQLSNTICQTRNETYKKWADKFEVINGGGYYVDASEVWSKTQQLLKGLS